MKNLQIFIHRESEVRGAPFDINDPLHRQELGELIDSQASPENLYCDGEVSVAQGARKSRFLTACARELLKIDPTIKLYEV